VFRVGVHQGGGTLEGALCIGRLDLLERGVLDEAIVALFNQVFIFAFEQFVFCFEFFQVEQNIGVIADNIGYAIRELFVQGQVVELLLADLKLVEQFGIELFEQVGGGLAEVHVACAYPVVDTVHTHALEPQFVLDDDHVGFVRILFGRRLPNLGDHLLAG